MFDISSSTGEEEMDTLLHLEVNSTCKDAWEERRMYGTSEAC